MRKEYRELEKTVFPSKEKTLSVIKDTEYNGAHVYYAKNCIGFENGETKYIGTEQQIRFVKKDNDGSIIPGLQTEQVILILIDRTRKLNDRFPSPENQAILHGLQEALHACEMRVKNRIDRGVMGQLKK